jgi:hypothetical protein
MDVSTQKSFHQISREEGQWMTYWQQHPHLPRWHAQTAIRHTRDEQLLHRVLDVWTGMPLKQRSDDHQSMEMPPEVWTTQPPTPSGDGASRYDHNSLVEFRCLIHCNNSLFQFDDEPQCLLPDQLEGLTSSTPPNKDDAEEVDDCPPLKAVAVVETATDNSPTAALSVSNCPKPSVLPVALFAALSQHFFYSGETGASSGDGGGGCVRAANQREKTAERSAGVTPPPAPAVMIRFQCQAASGMAGVWFRRVVGDAATGLGVDVCIDERITMALKTAGLCGSWRIAPSRVLSMLSDARTTTTTTVAPAGGAPHVHDTAEVTASRWLMPARVFSDALSLQGSVVQLMHRAPFLHPHGAVQEVFEIFGPCVVREWRGTRRSAPCFLITFTGERFAKASDLAQDDGDGADAVGNEEALSQSMARKAQVAAALLRQRRMCAAEDASFALAQLQRFFAVDWGLTLTYQFGASTDHRRGGGGGGGDSVQKKVVEVAIVATPAVVAAVSAVSESAVSPADTLVPAPPDEESPHDITSSKPKKKRYVAPNSQTVAEEQQEQQQRRPRVYHIPTIMCPHDGNCSMINDPDHQQVYLHRCTLPPPCAFESNPLHGPYFLH